MEELYDNQEGSWEKVIEKSPNGPIVTINISMNQWHTVRAIGSDTVISEIKDGLNEPISPEDGLG